MPFLIYPAEAILKNCHLETRLKQVFRGVADAIFRGYPRQVNYLCSKQLQNFVQALPRTVAAVESGILLLRGVASFIEGQLLLHEWKKILVDLASAGAGHAVRGPGAALLHEGAVVGGVMVADEKDGEGFPIRSGMTVWEDSPGMTVWEGSPGMTGQQGFGGGNGLLGMRAGQ